jgi:ribosomal protein S6
MWQHARIASRSNTRYVGRRRMSYHIAKSLQGYNLVSYFTFASDDDRAFFVKEDEAHQRLIKFLDGKLDKGIMVLDFIDGEAEGSVTNTS